LPGTPVLLLLLVQLAAASNPSASEASSLAQAGSWDDLFLKFGSAQPQGYSAADRTRVAQALLQGAQAMEKTDAVTAVSLAEKSVAFAETVPALLFAGELNQRLQQNGQAAKEYDRALQLDAHHSRAHLLRAELALSEGEPQVALAHLKGLPAAFEAARVKDDARRAEAALAQRQAGEAALGQISRSGEAPAPPPEPASPGKKGKKGRQPKTIAGGEPAEPGAGATVRDPISDAQLAGLRERANQHFVFSYGNNERDWGQRADYEGRVMDALEEAYEFVGRTLAANRTEKVQVVLYTRQEYEFHFGGSELSRAAGFFSGKIRINGAEEMTPEVETVIVHEYTHAVIDELVHHQHIPQWVHEGTATWVENEYRSARGLPGADDGWRNPLRQLARNGKLPRLAQLDVGFLGLQNPRVAYATSGQAIQILVERYGVETLGGVLRASAASPWAQAFASAYGEQSTLDDQVREALSQ
jgi:hypothetical protein